MDFMAKNILFLEGFWDRYI